MSLRTVVWGFDGSGVLEELTQQNRISVIEWIGKSGACTIHRENIYHTEFDDPELREQYRTLYAELYETHFMQFAQMYNRHNPENERNIHDIRDQFALYVNYIADIYLRNHIELFMVSCIPHVGSDYLFYIIAKRLGIKTVVLYQSVIPNCFFCMNTYESFGDFHDAVTLSSPRPFTFQQNRRNKPIYMRKIKKYSVGMAEVMKHALKHRSFQMLWKYSRFKQFVKQKRAMVSVPEYREPFVYFPLQLNPELTTVSLGGKFDDQVFAIEALSSMLPAPMKIYIKENPKQTEFMRGNYFFRRLRRLKNIVFVPEDTDTFELIEQSAFVANVTGTVGWEALTLGKNVLVFGQAWYRKLPGVFEYDEGIGIEEILSAEVDEEALKAAMSELLSKLGEGVIDPVYIPSVPDFDATENAERIAETIMKLL